MTTDELLAALPAESLVLRTTTGYTVKRRQGNGWVVGSGATIALALQDIGGTLPTETVPTPPRTAR